MFHELGMRAQSSQDGKENVLISAVLILVLEEICRPSHLCSLKILQAALWTCHLRILPNVLWLAGGVKARDHGVQGGVGVKVIRLETRSQLNHLKLSSIETSQLLFIVAPRFKRIHMRKDRNVGDRVQHIGEGGVLGICKARTCTCQAYTGLHSKTFLS